MSDSVAKKVDQMVINVSGMNTAQKKYRLEQERNKKNTVLIKRILSNDGILQLLSAQGVNDVSMINTEDVEFSTEPTKKVKPPASLEDEMVDEDPEKEQPDKEQSSDNKKNKKVIKAERASAEVALKQQQAIDEFKAKKAKAAAAAAKEEKLKLKRDKQQQGLFSSAPPMKKSKASKFTLDSSDSEIEPEDPEKEAVKFGHPQPDESLVLPATNSVGRRVYGICGSTNKTVLGGCFLLYALEEGKKNIYQFDESLLQSVMKATLKKFDVKSAAELRLAPSVMTSAGVFFVTELIKNEVKDCPKPTFLDRPIVSMVGKELKDMFNEIPEPVRSAIYKFARECGCFRGLDADKSAKVALEVDEIAQWMEPEIASLRLKYPAVAVDESFVHKEFV